MFLVLNLGKLFYVIYIQTLYRETEGYSDLLVWNIECSVSLVS